MTLMVMIVKSVNAAFATMVSKKCKLGLVTVYALTCVRASFGLCQCELQLVSAASCSG